MNQTIKKREREEDLEQLLLDMWSYAVAVEDRLVPFVMTRSYVTLPEGGQSLAIRARHLLRIQEPEDWQSLLDRMAV